MAIIMLSAAALLAGGTDVPAGPVAAASPVHEADQDVVDRVGHREPHSWNAPGVRPAKYQGYLEVVDVVEDVRPRDLVVGFCPASADGSTCQLTKDKTVEWEVSGEAGLELDVLSAKVGVSRSESETISVSQSSPPMQAGQQFVAYVTYNRYRIRPVVTGAIGRPGGPPPSTEEFTVDTPLAWEGIIESTPHAEREKVSRKANEEHRKGERQPLPPMPTSTGPLGTNPPADPDRRTPGGASGSGGRELTEPTPR